VLLEVSDTSGNATDIVSNDVLIQALRAPDGVRGLLRDELPASVYPAFAHETTHHWCFVSPIGATIALLRARSDVELYRARTSRDVTVAASGRVLSDALTTVFRPVAEGIALFAELNMRMSVTGLAVEPCEWVTYHLIRMPEIRAELRGVPDISLANIDQIPDELFQRFVATVNRFLDDARLTKEQVAARCRISMRRLDIGDGAYLAGYLLIKRGYNRLMRKVVKGNDANSFLAFAKEFFFHDTNLALGVLTGSVKGVADVVARMAERLRLFDSESIVELYQNFVPAAERTSRVAIDGRWKPTIESAVDVEADGDEKVFEAMTRILERDGPLLNSGDLNLEAGTILQRVYGRGLFKLGAVAGSLSTKRLNVPTGEKLPSMGVFMPDAAYNMDSVLFLPQKTEKRFKDVAAFIELLFWSTADRLVLACYSDLELVANSLSHHNLDPESASACEALLAERQALTKNVAILQKQAKVALEHAFKDFERDVDRQIRAEVDQVLTCRLFPNVTDPKGVFNRLRDRGLYELYDTHDRPERFARFCAIAACETGPSPSEISDTLSWSSLCESVTGWPMLERSGDRLLTAL
jgi:hypothetical protein